MTRSRFATAAAVFCVAIVAVSCGGGEKPQEAAGGTLAGVFKIAAGRCSDAGVTSGSFFRMVQPKGKVGTGPFVKNGDSPCGDKTFTPLSPGSDGGLLAGSYQPHPKPPFDASGNGAANALSQPQKWFAVAFSLATNLIDPQTKKNVAAPTIKNADGKLSGDLRAFAAAWNGQHFTQGAPKPDGLMPGNTTAPKGTYDPETKPTRSAGRARSSGPRSTTSRASGTLKATSSSAANARSQSFAPQRGGIPTKREAETAVFRFSTAYSNHDVGRVPGIA
jgi:hypothetical protein